MLLAINDEQIKAAVIHDDRPSLDVICFTESASRLSSLKEWIANCWHQSPDERPSFDGE